MLAVCCLLLSALCLRAELAFKWTVEVSQPLPYAAEALQGESFNLEAKVVQYRVPMLEAAEATFYYQTSEMEASRWYTVPAAWDATTATALVAFTPAMDVGSTKYRFFFGIETAQGKNYRVFGTLRLKASPGFSPATLKPTDVRAEIIQEILEAVFEEADDHYATKEEHAALAVQVQGKADASHTHSDLVKQRDVQQTLNESDNPVSARAVYQNLGNVIRYEDPNNGWPTEAYHGYVAYATVNNGIGGFYVGGGAGNMPNYEEWLAKFQNERIRVYADTRGSYEDYDFGNGSPNQIARKKDIPAAITVDSALSSTSMNPIQNKAVYAALASRPVPTVSVDAAIGLSVSGTNGGASIIYLADGGVVFSTSGKGDTRSATLVGQAALAGKADAQHTHAFEEMAVTVSGASYRWQWDETEGTFALVLE